MLYYLACFVGVVIRHVRAVLHPVEVGVAAVVEQDGRIVLVRHSYRPGWMFPGGGVDRNEPPMRAILRELQEEIGLSASTPPELLGAYLRPGLWVANLVLLYRVREAVFTFKPSLEIREAILVDPAQLPDGVTPSVRRRLAEMFGGQPTPKW